MLLQRCIDNDIHPDNCKGLKDAVCDMHGGWETAMRYYDIMRHETTTENTSIFRADEAFTSLISKKDKADRQLNVETRDKAEGQSNVDASFLEDKEAFYEQKKAWEAKVLLEEKKAFYEEKRAWEAKVSVGGGVSGTQAGLHGHAVRILFFRHRSCAPSNLQILF